MNPNPLKLGSISIPAASLVDEWEIERLEYLPPYSPDFNPIENLWSKVKQGLKSRAPRTARQLFKAAEPPSTPLPPKTATASFYMPDTLHD